MELELKSILIIFTTLSALPSAYAGDSSKMMRNTRNAIMSYDVVQKKADQFGKKIQELTLGDYTEEVLVFSPLVTGQVTFSAMDLDFYIDTRHERGGVEYNFKF